jgi:hypothetical protein
MVVKAIRARMKRLPFLISLRLGVECSDVIWSGLVSRSGSMD